MIQNQNPVSDHAAIMQWIFKRNGYPMQSEAALVTDNPPDEFDGEDEDEDDHDFDWE